MPASIRVTGPNVSEAVVKDYLGRAAEVCHAAGARVAVFGAAWSRNVPAGWSREVAHNSSMPSVGRPMPSRGLGPSLASSRKTSRRQTIIRFIDEAVGYAKAVNRPAIKVIVDFYHVDEEGTPLTEISRFGDWICHVQTADTGRNYPGSGHYDYAFFAEQLRIAGYNETVSVEVMKQLTPDQMAKSLEYLRGIWPASVTVKS
jgi:sugar phosphate isomerase/epimerase